MHTEEERGFRIMKVDGFTTTQEKPKVVHFKKDNLLLKLMLLLEYHDLIEHQASDTLSRKERLFKSNEGESSHGVTTKTSEFSD